MSWWSWALVKFRFSSCDIFPLTSCLNFTALLLFFKSNLMNCATSDVRHVTCVRPEVLLRLAWQSGYYWVFSCSLQSKVCLLCSICKTLAVRLLHSTLTPPWCSVDIWRTLWIARLLSWEELLTTNKKAPRELVARLTHLINTTQPWISPSNFGQDCRFELQWPRPIFPPSFLLLPASVTNSTLQIWNL